MSRTASSIPAYSDSGRRYECPDKEVGTLQSTWLYMPTRGSSHTMTVFTEKGRCLGYVVIERLGFPSVKAWMVAHPNWKRDWQVIEKSWRPYEM